MSQDSADLELADWEITAAAPRCDYIGDFVTVRINRDWHAVCAWYLKYKLDPSKKFGATIKQRIDKCVGPDCDVITKYRDKLIEEEFGKT